MSVGGVSAEVKTRQLSYMFGVWNLANVVQMCS